MIAGRTPAPTTFPKRFGQSGVVLMYVLGVVLLLSIVGMALLSYAATSARASAGHYSTANRIREFDGVLEIAVQTWRNDVALANAQSCAGEILELETFIVTCEDEVVDWSTTTTTIEESSPEETTTTVVEDPDSTTTSSTTPEPTEPEPTNPLPEDLEGEPPIGEGQPPAGGERPPRIMNVSVTEGGLLVARARVKVVDWINGMDYPGYSLEVCDWQLGAKDISRPLKGCV